MLLAGSWYDQLNPFHYLAGAAGKVVADAWTAAMLGLWNAGLWAMRLVLNIMDAFLTTAQMGPEKDIASSVVATPAAAQVKGTDGPDWVLACVLLDMRATITADARMGYGYCERMQWRAGRWMIAPGTPPARAPSTWPGSDLSIKAGWRTWATSGQE